MATAAAGDLLSQRAYARHRGVSHTAVQKAIRDGRLSKAIVKGKIDPTIADEEWELNTDPSTSSNSVTGDPGNAMPAKRRRGKAPPMPMDLDGAKGRSAKGGGGNGDGGNGEAHDTSYSTARTAREVYNAQLAKLKLDEQLGILVKADDVRVAAYNEAKRARDQLVAMPARVAPMIAAITDASEVLRILEDEIEAICRELSGAKRG